ncbi:nucleotidyltransferase family protein [Marivirga salinae]|uniref:Nucleotidyltransferase family protein n=1 Tax=Marivirga salinarum TaxID=3059078 RepID=A0AA51N9G1_9BACT|nr:nucleotidyltransferase family protein [Marivirga sp. BDSF4-3]WMN10914.1 nucleotidyltransferase family protein [Marivirga sp. BDSF4-3]
MTFKKHLIKQNCTVKEALAKLDLLAADAILFVVDEDQKLVGSLTDGDVRRGLLKDMSINQKVVDFIQPTPKFIIKSNYNVEDLDYFRKANLKIIPVLNDSHQVVNVINFRFLKSYLPIDVIIMAGGKGTRLKPLTDKIPKPLLKVADKPIIEHNIDRLISYGIDDFWLSINYFGNQLKDYFKNGESKGVQIDYVTEDKPLGTIGAVRAIKNLKHDTVLITNSDILTNLDYEDFYKDFIQSDADLSVVTIPYEVLIPYAVLETEKERVKSFKEKPTYTYYSNGGIYLIKKELLNLIPENEFYNATDLMAELIKQGKKVKSYPLIGYWLDIGKHEDFKKAQEDFKYIKF